MAKRLPVRLTDLKHGQCRWVHGDPAKIDTHRYCGRETVPTTSWCIRHLRRVTPHAQTIINRELTKWEIGEVATEVVIAQSWTKSNERDTERSDRTKDVVEEIGDA